MSQKGLSCCFVLLHLLNFADELLRILSCINIVLLIYSKIVMTGKHCLQSIQKLGLSLSQMADKDLKYLFVSQNLPFERGCIISHRVYHLSVHDVPCASGKIHRTHVARCLQAWSNPGSVHSSADEHF